MNLTQLKTNSVAVIETLNGESHFLSRIVGMGFTPTAKIKMIQNKKGSALIVFIKDTMVAIESKEAENIIVREFSNG